MDYQKVGKFIKEQRDKLGLSQQDLGDKVHVTRQAVSNWETGKDLPDSDILVSLSKLFNVTINEILGESSMEEVTLSLLDETNKKNHIIKKILKVSTITICILSFLFFGLYFINNYNSIKVYKASSQSEHFKIIDGIIISTSQNTYFKLGHLEYKKSDSVIVNKVKLYYLSNKKKFFIFESDVNDRLFVNNEGYDEIQKQKFSKYKDNLYLEVYFNNTEKEVLKIDLKEDFTNDYFMVLEESSVVRDLIKTDIPELKLDFEQQELKTNIIEDKPVIKYEPVPLPSPQPVQKPVEQVQEVVEQTNPAPVEEPISLEPQEPVIEEPTQVEEPIVEEPQEEININLEEISQLIEQYGRLEFKTYRLDYTLDDGTIVRISKNRNNVVVESFHEEEFIRYSINLRDGETIYQETINDLEIEKIMCSLQELINNNIIIAKKLDSYFSLVYQEI